MLPSRHDFCCTQQSRPECESIKSLFKRFFTVFNLFSGLSLQNLLQFEHSSLNIVKVAPIRATLYAILSLGHISWRFYIRWLSDAHARVARFQETTSHIVIRSAIFGIDLADGRGGLWSDQVIISLLELLESFMNDVFSLTDLALSTISAESV